MADSIPFEYWATVSGLSPKTSFTIGQHQDKAFGVVSSAIKLDDRAQDFFTARGGLDGYIATLTSSGYPPTWANTIKQQIIDSKLWVSGTTNTFTANFEGTF